MTLTRSLSTIAALALTLTLALASAVQAAPEPNPIPTRWELKFEPGPLRIAEVNVPGEGRQKFLYFTYRVTNHSGTDRIFTPSFDLKTDDGEVRRSGRDVPSVVTDEILARLDSPFMKDQIAILGQLLQGFEHARDGVVIWPLTDTQVDRITIFAGGFSGENAIITVKDPETGEPTRVVLRKTRMLVYDTPGELRDRGAQALPLTEDRWIMR